MTEKEMREKMIDEIIIYLMTMHGYCRDKARMFAEDIVDYIFEKIDD